jgi:hypothetical protein
MKQGETGWLISSNGGSHEFQRVYWAPIKRLEGAYGYSLRDGFARLGAEDLVSADIDATGLTLGWSKGSKSWIPLNWFQFTYAV